MREMMDYLKPPFDPMVFDFSYLTVLLAAYLLRCEAFWIEIRLLLPAVSMMPAMLWAFDITEGFDVEKDIITDFFKLLLKVSTSSGVYNNYICVGV